MAAVICPNCRATSQPGSRFCGVCGTPLPIVPGPLDAASWVSQAHPLVPPGWVPVSPGAQPLNAALDLPVLSNLQIAAALTLIGAILGGFVEFGLGPVFHLDPATALRAGGGSVASLVEELEILVLVSTAVSIASLYMLRLAFARLAPVDDEFRSPSTLTLVGIVGLIVVDLGLVLLFQVIVTALNCVGTSTTTPPSCADVGGLLGGLALVGLGVILALIGIIAAVIGIWRLGTRYNDDLLHVGAILWIIPFASIAGMALIIYASHRIRQGLAGRSVAGPPSAPLR